RGRQRRRGGGPRPRRTRTARPRGRRVGLRPRRLPRRPRPRRRDRRTAHRRWQRHVAARDLHRMLPRWTRRGLSRGRGDPSRRPRGRPHARPRGVRDRRGELHRPRLLRRRLPRRPVRRGRRHAARPRPRRTVRTPLEGHQVMPIKAFWYLTQADGDCPWSPGGLYPVDGQRQIELAKTIDDGCFEGALVATWPNDPFISATWAAAHTSRMKFLVAIYANMTPARLLAEKALTFDAFSGGRLMINSVNGRENILTKYDMNVEHDRRYELGEQYCADFRRIYAGGTE